MKGKGFHKLRIAAVSAGTVLASLFGAVTRSVRASTNLPVAHTSATRWQVQSSNCAEGLGVPGNDCGIGVRQYSAPEIQPTTATIIAPPPTTPTYGTTTPVTSQPTSTTTNDSGSDTTSPGTTSPPVTTSPPPASPTDPFTTDSYHGHIAGPPPSKPTSKTKISNAIVAFNRSLGLAVNSTVFKAPAGKVDLSAKIVTTGPQTIAGLETRVQYQLDGPSRSVRAIFTFHNLTTKVVVATMNTNLGVFGGNSAIKTTSSGNAAVTINNRWFETTGTFDTTANPRGPSVVFVGYGKNARPMLRSLSNVSLPGSGIDFVASYDVNVAPDETVAIMVFAEANDSTQPKESIDSVFANLATLMASHLLKNLPLPQEKILNWNGPVRPIYGVAKRPKSP
jgi:hypothetical protein